MKHLLISLVTLSLSLNLQAQAWQELVRQETNFNEAANKVDAFYRNREKGKGSGYKQYMRWKEQMEYHTGLDGRMYNSSVLNYLAFEEVKASANHQRAVHGEWENLGPFDYSVGNSYSQGGLGRVNCMAFHPTNSLVFWAGTPAGGLWKTTNGGMSWQPLTDGFASIGISAIAVHPEDANIIYVLTGDGDGGNSPSLGVMKTVNGGQSWHTTGLSFEPDSLEYGFSLVIHPENPDTLIAGFRGLGMFRTDDGGITWMPKMPNTSVWDIEFNPSAPNTIYAASNINLLKSINGGETWSTIDDPDFPNSFARMAIAISPEEPSNVYALFGGSTGMNGTFRGLFKSTNLGEDFTMQSNTPCILDATLSGNSMDNQAAYDLALIVDPDNDARVFVGGINTWKSENNGIMWSRETYWTREFSPTDPYVHADFHNFYFRETTLFATNDGGIYKTEDYGNSWTELSAGLCIMQFYNIDVLNDSYAGGTQDNGTNGSSYNNPQFSHLEGGDGFGTAWHTGDNSIQYLTTQNSLLRRQFGTNITIWEENDGFWFTDIKMHTTLPDYFFFCKGRELFRANQDGPVWSFHFDSLNAIDYLPNYNIRGFVQGSGVYDDIMYAVSRSTIIKSTNINTIPPTWDSLPNPVAGITQISEVMVSPTNPNKVWISCAQYTAGQKMYYSTNGGTSWENISGSLPNIPINDIAYSPGKQDGIYIGTDIGVFYRDATMSDWLFYSTYMPNVPVRDLQVEDGYIYAGTFGRGFWRSEVYACPSSLILTPENDPSDPLNMGKQQFSAQDIITSTRVIQNTTADILYKAGNYIDLKVGFWTKSGSQLMTKIEGCPD